MTAYVINGSGGGGMVDPLTTEGDIIIADATGAPIRLPVGATGYFLRSAAGRPAWREYSAAGLLSARPAAAAVREGMVYWATDEPAGSEGSQCVHQGGTTYAWVTLPYGTPSTIVQAGASSLIGLDPAGTAIISDGAGAVQMTSADVSAMLAAADAAAARAAIGAASSATLVGGAALTADITAATLLAAIDAARVTTPSLVSEAAGGWTPIDVTSPGTITVTGGEIVASIPNASTTTQAGGKESCAWPASGRMWEVQARYESTGDTSAEIEGILRIDYAVGNCYAVLNAAGTWQVYSNFDGSENVALLGSLTGMPRDGTGWLRIRINGQRVTIWTGIGVVGAPPIDNAWTVRYDADRALAIGKTSPTALVIGGRSNGTHSVSGATTVRWSQVSVRNLGLGG